MISYNRNDYKSASEWLASLRQDDAWLSQLQQLQTSSSDKCKEHHKMAVKRIEEGSACDFWYFYNHHVEKVIEELWESGETTLPKLKILAIWMLTLEWLEQRTEASGQDRIMLPKELDKPHAREAFAKAMERKYMEATDDGKYRWIGTGKKANTSELAYFLGRVYNYKHTTYGNAGESFPEESLNELFGVARLYSSLTQVYNAKRKQSWRSLIDDIFDEG
ncbi:hypothetical protein [Xylanibacter brevis]|uniref:hypothetical protein n=1 Tax=Xylanibacter brevis TaxID=83231 RepID=UPI000485ACE3|nr:hypothetical protein [Xylanibacter brevis]